MEDLNLDGFLDMTASYGFHRNRGNDNHYVTLEVFDLAGQRLATLVQGRRAAGTHGVWWDGRDDAGRPLASGPYVYRLRAGNRVESRKLLLLQ